jgi:ABC-type dipeptide/oligopeptide/nickel transport system ATPase subunit
MQEIKITIENLKRIKKLEFIFELKQGFYAIVGNNGSGKSSLMTTIAKLVRPSIFKEEFAGIANNFSNAKITYTSAYGMDIVWQKNPNWQAVENAISMPKFKGFYESSILTGTRFYHLNNKKFILKNKDIENSKEAPEFIKNNLDYIINGSKTTHFQNLYYVNINKDKRIYYIKFNQNNYVNEFNLSTGEYFLLSILKIIYGFSNRRQKDDLRLLIIDEIDIALHPLAQKRFVEKLKEWMIDFNLLIVFATHSLQIIKSLSPNEIYYLDDNKIYNPIYPAYLTSKLYEHISYDKIILVEDDLAKRYINKLLISINIEGILYKIIPIGGWEKVLEIYNQNEKFKYFGSADVLVILDGDIISDANKGVYKKMHKTFLPFKNIERYISEQLFISSKFQSSIEAKIYPTKITNLNIFEINQSNFQVKEANTDKIKKIFKKLIEEISIYSEFENIDVLNFFIEFIYEEHNEQRNQVKLKDDLNYFFTKVGN